MKQLETRAAHLARTRQRSAVGRIAAALKDFRGMRVEAEDTLVRISGRGLMRRWLMDPSLRFVSGGAK